MQSHRGTTSIILFTDLRAHNVLHGIIERERRTFWSAGTAVESATERKLRERHENLLALATFALDLPREKFECDCPQEALKHLPSQDTLDEDRYRRMAGGNPYVTFARLDKPDACFI